MLPRCVLLLFIALIALSCPGCGQPAGGEQPEVSPSLVTGKAISPRVEATQDVGSMPLNVAVCPSGRFLVTTDIGNRQALWSIRTADGKGVSHVEFANKREAADAGAKKSAGPTNGEAADEASTTNPSKTNGLYYGLAFSKDNVLYAAQGAHNSIAILSLSADGSLMVSGSIPTKRNDFPAGLAVDDRGRLYVANNAAGGGNPLKLTASVAIYDPAQKKELGRYTFDNSHGGTSNFPLSIAVLRGGGKAYVASERDNCVYVLDTSDASNPRQVVAVETGAHPVAVLLSRDQSRLYVANSLGDTISIIDTTENRVADTILLRPVAARDIPGVTPTGMAFSPDEKTLYVTLADMNAIALIDLPDSAVSGYIPAGWYPSAVAVSTDGKRLFVTNAKGSRARNPNNMRDPFDPKRQHLYVLSALEGNLSTIEIPSGDDLKETSRRVLENNRVDRLERSAENPLAAVGLAAGKIKHVIYIIKENRTYDEVLGDLPQGNGDPSLVLFGRDITPNQHALAERFVLLDNLYACGEVSGDGWCWSTQGMADAYVARNVPYNYSNRGRKFDFEGTNNTYPTAGLPPQDEQGKPLAAHEPFSKGLPAIPDVANTGRNIWDVAKEAGVSLRNYGFFLYFSDDNAGAAGGPDNNPVATGLLPPGHDLAGTSDADFRRFDMDYPDSDAPETYFKKTGDKQCLYSMTKYGKYDMPSRFSEWNREFQIMLAKDATGGAVPALTLVRLPLDHTVAAKAGKHTPRSYIADNDCALGEIVEAVSRSPIWKETAIIVIEDDAQSGADHVDCHRTIGFVVSPWIKAHSVDHRFYNTDSMLKTTELLLGLKPLCQYDAIADPVLDWDTSASNAAPFRAILPSEQLVAETNPRVESLGSDDPRREMATKSAAMDFTHADNLPAREANEIIWQTVKGPQAKMPQPRGTTGDED
jgi:YVTN family beta-propeller protein